MCCTAPCEVLGVGIPLWTPIDSNNLLTGGLRITHMGVPPAYVPAAIVDCGHWHHWLLPVDVFKFPSLRVTIGNVET